MPKLLLTVEDAAKCLSIGRSHLYSLMLRGEVESVHLGRSRRIPSAALEAFVAKLSCQPTDKTPAGS